MIEEFTDFEIELNVRITALIFGSSCSSMLISNAPVPGV